MVTGAFMARNLTRCARHASRETSDEGAETADEPEQQLARIDCAARCGNIRGATWG
jgi:hypothetical protein